MDCKGDGGDECVDEMEADVEDVEEVVLASLSVAVVDVVVAVGVFVFVVVFAFALVCDAVFLSPS